MLVALFTSMFKAERPLKVTESTLLKLSPEMDTLVRAAPEVGLKVVMLGKLAVTTKSLTLSTEPPWVTTPILPVLAPDGTWAVMLVLLPTKKAEFTPLNVTWLTFTKPVPVMFTVVPEPPLVGEKLLMVCAWDIRTHKMPSIDKHSVLRNEPVAKALVMECKCAKCMMERSLPCKANDHIKVYVSHMAS
jgi:hypothetical protein